MARKIPTSIVFGIASTIGRLIRILRLFRRETSRQTQIVWPPSGWGSLGDEGILSQVVLSGLQRGVKRTIVLQTNKGVSWKGRLIIDDNLAHLTIAANITLRGLFSLSWNLLRALLISRDFIVIGADVVDGAYGDTASRPRLALAHCAASAGLRCTITGFSFSEAATDESIRAFRRLSPHVYFTCRDPVSKKRFEKAVGRIAGLSADLVFLLNEVQMEKTSTIAIKEWLRQKHSEGVAVVGLNLNDHALRMAYKPAKGESDHCVTKVIAGLRMWRENAGFGKMAVLLFPSDNRECESGSSDFGLARKFQQAMRHEIWADTKIFDYPITLQKAQSVLSDLDVLISCRMHACILALNARVPIVAVEYAGKFEGILAHFFPRKIGVLLSPDNFLQPCVFGKAIHKVWLNRTEYSESIEFGLPVVQDLARNNYRPADMGIL